MSDLFTSEEIDKIVAIGDSAALMQAEMYKGIPSAGYRKSELTWFNCNDETAWIFNKILPAFKGYTFSRLEYFQYTVYKVGGYFNWHVDNPDKDNPANAVKDRVVAGILQLSDPEDYDGGELQYMTSATEGISLKRRKGSLLIIGCGVLHRVTEVTRGVRKSLVMWGLS